MDPDLDGLTADANYCINWFGYTLHSRRTNPALAGIEIDLGEPDNREAIRAALAVLIREHGLREASPEDRVRRLCDVVERHERRSVGFAALCSALSIQYIDGIASLHFSRSGPDHPGLQALVQDLTKHCCTGAAQMLGAELPPEVAEAWPSFARLFAEAKGSPLWPALL